VDRYSAIDACSDSASFDQRRSIVSRLNKLLICLFYLLVLGMRMFDLTIPICKVSISKKKGDVSI
jgi:hypothetical protein